MSTFKAHKIVIVGGMTTNALMHITAKQFVGAAKQFVAGIIMISVFIRSDAGGET